MAERDDVPEQHSSASTLARGSVPVAEVMSGVDWASTPVGPRDSWPALLDSLVRVVLKSRFPMWMGWGPELTFFYNDAYRRDTLGIKHPWALGRPAREVWAEIWDDISPRLEAGLRGEATWDEALLLFLERSGYREETYHTFSYSPITARDGSVAGILCVVTEETDRVVGERRMATLRRLASDLSATRTEEDVHRVVAARLAEDPYDLPWTATYLFDPDGTARLVCATGTPPGGPAARETIDPWIDVWPIDRLQGSAVVVDDVPARVGEMPTGAWDVASSSAVVVGLSQRGRGEKALAGFFVAGCNPYRPVDAVSVGFVELLAGQVAAGIASARAYEAERRRAEVLAELDRAKTEFFSNVSHELRTPLTLILGPAEDMLADGALGGSEWSRLDAIVRNARRLRRLVNDMLDFARIEGGRLRAETVATDLAGLTWDITRSFAPAVERSGLSLSVDCPPLDRPVYVDRDMWERIVLNLLSNALKFTMTGSISVRLVQRDATVELTVADTGIGIAPEQVPQLFQRFYRAPRADARSHEGAGIGLALVHQLVTLHGGGVHVESRDGEGSAFTVRIPFGSVATGPAPALDGSTRQSFLEEALQWLDSGEDGGDRMPALRSAGPTAEATVLLVDDNPDMRRYVRSVLSPYWRVVTADSGAQALAAARAQRPDLVLSDVMLPGLDGIRLVAALRADPQTATVPVVLLSARAGEDAAITGLDAGADDYVVKPFSALELVARVRANLELSAMRSRETAWRTALVDSLEEAVIVLDSSGTVIEVNPAFEHIFGYPASEVPYTAPMPWVPDPSDTAGGSGEARIADVFAGVRQDGSWRGTLRLRHRDGHPVWVAASVQSIVVGEDRRFVATLRDVTAELLSAEREGALAQLGIALAEAGDVRSVLRAGLTELRRVFGASGAGVAGLAAGPGGGSAKAGTMGGGAARARVGAAPEGDDEWVPDTLVEAVAAVRRGARVCDAPAPDRNGSAGLAAPLDPAGPAAAVWLAFDPPRRVSAEDRSLFAVVCGYFGQAIRRAQLFDDNRAVATAMQRSILGPTDVPPDVSVRYAPAVQPLEVGGDWYDVVELPGTRLGLVVGDCVGRGLPAATVMGQLRSACRALLLQARTPAEAVGALDAFAERIPGAVCTTVLCGIVDLATGTLGYCNAGHVPGVVLHPDGGQVELSQARSVPLGVTADIRRSQDEVQLAPGSTVVLYTDGLIERRGEGLTQGLARLFDAVASGLGLPPSDLADHLSERLLAGADHEDDVAMVVYHRPAADAIAHDPTGGTSADLTVVADPAALSALRGALSAWMSRAGLAEPGRSELLVAVGEAVANAMEHGYGFDGHRTVSVRCRSGAEGVEVSVRDRGSWRPPAPAGPSRGRGLTIMEGLADGLDLQHDADGTTVTLRKRVRAGAGTGEVPPEALNGPEEGGGRDGS